MQRLNLGTNPVQMLRLKILSLKNLVCQRECIQRDLETQNIGTER